MCGIAGYIGKKIISEHAIFHTLERMKNRGPDNQSYIQFEDAGNQIYLLHARLSIIDLEARSNQPFTIGDYTVIYNGEIYNYIELREKLEKENIRFYTKSDTEVLLQYYIKYGESCVDHFNGMWSFAIYNKKEHNLFISRDRFAEKPLYYYQTSDGFYFGSEIKFLQSLSENKFTVNYNHLLRYLINGYKSLYKQSCTYYNEAQELPYASNLIISASLQKNSWRYWHPEKDVQIKKMSMQEAIEGTRHHLIESMKLRLRSDVPLAFCLSGGVDSSALASIAAKVFNYDVATFSIIDSDERYNEYDNIAATVNDLGCKNTMIHLDTTNTFEKLKNLIAYHDSPIATITYFVHSFISEKISNSGYKVAFSGTSADELFTGYYDHFNLFLYEVRNHPNYQHHLSDWKKYTGTYVRNPYFKNPELYFTNPDFRDHIYMGNDEFSSYLKKSFSESFFEEKFTNSSLLRNRMLNELFHEATPLILHEDDLNSMKYSIENRSPYLDTNLFRFAYSIPTEYLINDGFAKHILRESVKGILNDQVRLDRQKKGFNASITSIINFNDKNTRDYLLSESPIFDILNKSKIEEAVSKTEFPNSFSKFLFNFVSAKMFLEQ